MSASLASLTGCAPAGARPANGKPFDGSASLASSTGSASPPVARVCRSPLCPLMCLLIKPTIGATPGEFYFCVLFYSACAAIECIILGVSRDNKFNKKIPKRARLKADRACREFFKNISEEKYMKDLKCGLRNCRFNKGYCCCAKAISIAADTDCESYAPLAGKNVSLFEAADDFVKANYTVDTEVGCSAPCVFQKSNRCAAAGITVMGDPAADALCLTYIKK
ncbi:MAG: DUF1540 domain-containing protein [Clostridiales bacterium]|jgi:hypothetical protein|nr:DUF1540 domain-containing protein [Clostridiales bacterium]